MTTSIEKTSVIPDGWLAKQLRLACEEVDGWPDWKKAELDRQSRVVPLKGKVS